MAGNDDYGILGERLRALRHKARLTQAKLAENADISCVYVNKLERGLAVPSLQVLNRLAKSLNTDAASLLAAEPLAAPSAAPERLDKSGAIDQAMPASQPDASGLACRASVHQPSPYLALYLSGTKRSARNLVFQTTETPLPPLPSAARKTQK
ncbi:MAG TPA: helix-turn-helix transcriptional regulator [Humidesulfovibrio sp.]|uniref:helix-turn-helix domain-containing protein n=1 Tax=Humidesulfovibrio sp. TaxID=2910988 RepID=UPI002BF51463|nr:helix-turn-helix transcriptional regulator [Humidesulfovibrio sp.]HWR03543.1 helix-turn-helix transcriptional regulator [Humidesulfovibrio sp.]